MQPRIAILGGGAVGLTLAARLAGAKADVYVITRRKDAAAGLESGLVAEDAATGTTRTHAVRAGLEIPSDRPILLCTRCDSVEAAVDRIAAVAPATPVVTFQNDVDNEARAARMLRRVIGGVWRETCTRLEDARVRYQLDRPARAILGVHPGGEGTARDSDVTEIAALLRSGDIDVGVSEDIAADKWLKLCVNLTSAPNALVRRDDHRSEAFSEIKIRLLEEARDALRAAGIHATSCDGRDRSINEEISHHRTAVVRGASSRPIPLFNQVWSSLTHGTPLEADAYHRRVLALVQDHGLAAPVNERVLEALLEAHASGSGPEQLAARDLLP